MKDGGFKRACDQRKNAVAQLWEYTKEKFSTERVLTIGQVKDGEYVFRKSVSANHPFKEGWRRSYGITITISQEDQMPPFKEEEL